MAKHGDKVGVNSTAYYPVNVCGNKECEMDFILLRPRESGFPWEQLANKRHGLYCPYCGEEIQPE